MPEFTRDPVCGMPVREGTGFSARGPVGPVFFCSEYCRESYCQRLLGGLVFEEAAAPTERRIAYFSMEIALNDELPTYSGGLGVLAGDMLRSAADLGVPIVAVTLVHRRGYFKQELSAQGQQEERPAGWSPESSHTALPKPVEVSIEGRFVLVRAWRYDILGSTGKMVPVLLLDTDVPGNSAQHRRLTDVLYGGDERYRLAQEVVLGIGGMRMLAAAGYTGLERIHMNEGHAALAALELLGRSRDGAAGPDFERVRRQCVFTTHTPVAAGHDSFDLGLVREVVTEPLLDDALEMLSGRERLNMTHLALNLSHYVNGVARKHEQVAEGMFPGHDIRFITNGVHSSTWTCPSFRALFDLRLPGWREDPAMLRRAAGIGDAELRAAHQEAKEALLEAIQLRTGRTFDVGRLTLGFARRATGYKRADLVFHDTERLRTLGRGRLQLVFAGKAHPRDEPGKALIRRVFEAAHRLGDDVPVVYLPEYDVPLAKLLVSGVDVWLNTPQRPLEASGTSGMKAAHNGVPSLSVLDGWWLEGCVEGITGWAIGGEAPGSAAEDARALYEVLANKVLPLYQGQPQGWASVMRQAIALNASFFNTHRMVQQYVTNAYLE